jgi:hypothetical protein
MNWRRLRKGSPPVIARIRGDALLRRKNGREQEIKDLSECCSITADRIKLPVFTDGQ